MYKSKELKLGRVFEVRCEPGDDYFTEINKFVRDHNIRAGSVFLLGALSETEMISGFRTQGGYDVTRHNFSDWRELVAYGNISWPEKPPAALGEGVVWDEPQPFVHIHMALSGGPGHNDDVLVGHLSNGKIKGGLMTQIYELVQSD
ncbi:DNA-binding protein [Ancylobacter sonchi]|uniref:PPC domain-containing DNA-binding protein n=1 Tax=Ancylobacter sonchi TaxID=1937790 RepID=UPI001BD4F2BB|nr:PPC domain-containing DNA-binding protein [Ancylobacter sonchi]MBS7532492.1 DNA-binding protein [Ancylobacter sonchi]